MCRRRSDASLWVALVLGVLLLLAPVGEAADLKVSNLVVTNSDKSLMVQAVLLGALPEGLVEGLETGIPAVVRFQVELWQYNTFWVDRRIAAKVVERQVHYDILTKEYRVTAVQGESREPYVTRDLWEAKRVISELRALHLAPIDLLKLENLYYVRLRAEIRPATPEPSLTKLLPPFLSSGVETSWEKSPLLTMSRQR